MLSNPWTLIKEGKEVKFRAPFGTMAEMIDHWAEKQPEKTVIEYIDVDKLDKRHPSTSLRTSKGDKKYTWRELKEEVFAAAEMLKRRGLKPGDTIAFAYHNHPDILTLSLGAWISGIRTTPLDLKRDDEWMMKYKVELSGAKVIFVARDLRSLRRRFSVGIENKVLSSSSSMISEISSSVRLNVSLQSEALVLFTSGTTAKPKGALLTQENLVANADGIADWLDIKSTDKFMILLPLHHINSITMSLATLLRGGTIVLVSRYTNSQFFEIAAKTGATLTSVVPTIIHDQLMRFDHFNKLKRKIKLSRIQLGSAPVVVKEAEEFVRLTGIPLIQGYGQTETALRSTGAKWGWKNLRSNTIGEEMKWTNVTILKEEGSEGKEGQEGEICVRGPVIMKEYLKNPEATEETFKYGWFHSGDLGYFKMIDGRKQFFIKGRLKEIIIKAGVNVSPMAVEEKILAEVPGIDQVYVVGIPDERAGEEMGAVVVMISKTSPSAHPVVIKGLSSFETPKYWFSIRAEKLPMTSTGKVQRVKLREMFKDCAAIAETDKYMFRVISAAEEGMIEEARQMYNKYWAPLSADKKSWEKEVRQKTLIGAIGKKTGELGGWIRLRGEGKSVLADAVTSRESRIEVCETFRRDEKFRKLLTGDVEIYLKKRIDPIIEFHRKPKAGWKRGAKIVKPVENARPGDTPALGWGVLMEYPEFTTMPAPRLTDASLGMQLVEAGLVYAKKAGFDRVRVLSRPVGLMNWVIRNTRKTRKARLSDSRRIGGSED